MLFRDAARQLHPLKESACLGQRTPHAAHRTLHYAVRSLVCLLIVAISSPANAFTDECTQDPIYPVNPYENGYAASDCSLDGNGSLALIGEFGAPHLSQPEVTNAGVAMIYHYVSGTWSKAYVFTRTGPGASGWTLEGQLVSDSSDPSYEYLGWSVSIDGNAALVGAKGGTSSPAGFATVFAYSVSTHQWSSYADLNPSTTAIGFGFSVALSSSMAVVGAPFAGTDLSGRAFVYRRSSGAWNEVLILDSSSPSGPVDQLGATLALRGSQAIIGALGSSETSQMPKTGSVVFFGDLPDPDCQ